MLQRDQLHQYQEFAVQKLIENPAFLLLLKPGLGKTISTLTAIDDLLYDNFLVNKILVIAPLRVAHFTWAAEAQNWKHTKDLTFSLVLGTRQQREKALEAKARIYVINRENIPWLVDYCHPEGGYGKLWPFDMVVIDESSSFKSHSSGRFKKLRRVRPLIKRVVELTGTPASNGLMDLWAQVYLLDRGQRLGKTITAFRDRYFNPGERDGHIVYNWVLKPGAEKAIYDAISDICLSMSADDWLDLPARQDIIVKVPLTEQERKLYKQLECDLLIPYETGDVVASNAGTLSGKLLQMANGAVYDEHNSVKEIHNGKLDALEDLIEAANGNPALVFYWYKHDKERIEKRFKVRHLDTEQDLEDWNAGKIPILLVHPASVGYGLNLQAGGNIIVWFGLTWSLELYEQANARLDRQGQKNSVIVHHLVAEKTIDERVIKALQTKACSQNDLMAAVRSTIEELRGGYLCENHGSVRNVES